MGEGRIVIRVTSRKELIDGRKGVLVYVVAKSANESFILILRPKFFISSSRFPHCSKNRYRAVLVPIWRRFPKLDLRPARQTELIFAASRALIGVAAASV